MLGNQIGGIIGGIQGANTANSAAALQAKAAQESNTLLDTAQTNSTEALREGQTKAYDNLSPYIGLGANATTNLNNLMDPNSDLYKGFQGQLNLPGAPQLTQFQAPNPQDVLNNPAIQFQLQQGQKAIQNSAAAKGGLNSGATLERVNQYAQGVASQGYNDLFSRSLAENQAQNQTAQQGWQNQYNSALQNFNSAAGIYQQTQQNRLSTLNSALQAGGSAASQASNQAYVTGTQISNNQLNVASQKGGNLQGGANATAAGKVAAQNQWNGVYGSAANAATGLYGVYQQNKNSGSNTTATTGGDATIYS